MLAKNRYPYIYRNDKSDEKNMLHFSVTPAKYNIMSYNVNIDVILSRFGKFE